MGGLLRRQLALPIEGARLAGLVVVCIVAGAYGASFYDTYLGLSVDGWFFHFGEELRRGVVPYRDYFFWTTPFHIIEHAIVGKLLGSSVAAGHAVGATLRVVTIAVTYLWFTRRRRIALGIVVAIAVLVVGYDDNCEPLFYYTQQATLYGVLGGYLASVAFDRMGRAAFGLWAASGCAIGLAIMTKHTIGAGAMLPVAAHAIVAHRTRARATGTGFERAGPAGALALGAALPIGGVLAWLLAEGALGAFLRQVFVEAPRAKGPVSGTLTRMFTVVRADGLFLWTTVVGVALVVAMLLLRAMRLWLDAKVREQSIVVLGATLAAVAALGAGFWGTPAWPHPRAPQLVASALSIWGCLVLAVVHAVRLARAPKDAEIWQRSLFASTSFFLAYAMSLSWGLYEQMVVPALACVIDEFAGNDDERRGGEMIERWLAAALCLVLTATGVACKRTIPYDWSLWREPPLWVARAASHSPELAGMSLSASTAEILDELTDDITKSTSDGDRVFVYPYMPLLYELSHRRPPTFGRVHWFDVTPDDVCEADARRLLADPPKVVVMTRFEEAYYHRHERLFRGGAPSGQRAIEAAIAQLAPRYDAIDEVRLPYTRLPIVVLLRKD